MAVIQFSPPADNERGPIFLERLIEGWVSLVGEEGIELGIASVSGQVVFQVSVPEKRQRVVAAQLANAYSGMKVTVLPLTQKPLANTSIGWLRLSPDVFSLKLHHSFVEEHTRSAVDPLESLLEIIKSGRSGRVSTAIWLKLTPLKRKQVERAKRNARHLESRFPLKAFETTFERNFSGTTWQQRATLWCLRRLFRPTKTVPAAIEEKLQQHLFSATLRIEVATDQPNQQLHQQKMEDIQSTIRLLTAFSSDFFLEESSRASFMLSAPEIATLWHFPIADTNVPRLERHSFKELEPPVNLPTKQGDANVVTLGRTCFRNEQQTFGMDIEARRRHLYIVGKSGMGKSTLLQSIITEDISAGRGLAVIDPHGDLAENILNYVPKHRTNDVVWFDPADSDYAVSFNPLMVSEGGDKTLVADGVLSAFQKVFGMDESQAPRLLHIFRNSLLSLVEMPAASLLDVQRLLVEPMYRKSVIAQVSNPVVRSFWLDEFNKWKPHDRTVFVASLQNKLGAFLTNPKLQRILSQSPGKVDLRQIMDKGKILIVNLSKGRVGENVSNLLGTLIVTSLQLAAMSRASIVESARRDFSIIIDEFQNFATPSIATFLSEARKYRTHLILANQYTRQLPEEILLAVLGNVGSTVAFQIGTEDTELFERQFGQTVTADNLLNIPKYHAYCRLLNQGMPSRPFSMKTIPTKVLLSNRAGTIRRTSNSHWAIKQ